MNKAKRLLLQYRDIINRLKGMGVVRTGKVVADYGEYIAAKELGLKLVKSSSNKGYDAEDKKGNKYEIKARKSNAWNKATIFPVKEAQLNIANYLIYVEFNDNWDLVKLLKIPCSEIKYNNYNRVIVTKTLIEKYSILKK